MFKSPLNEPEREESINNYQQTNQIQPRASANLFGKLLPSDKYKKILNNFEDIYRTYERKSAIERKKINDLDPDRFIKDVIK